MSCDAARGATHARAGARPLTRSLAPDRGTTPGRGRRSTSDRRAAVSGSARPQIERVAEVAHVGTHSRARLELESPGDELDDGCRVVGRLVHVAAPGEGRNDDRGNAR